MKNLSSKIVDYNNGKETECAFEFWKINEPGVKRCWECVRTYSEWCVHIALDLKQISHTDCNNEVLNYKQWTTECQKAKYSLSYIQWQQKFKKQAV